MYGKAKKRKMKSSKPKKGLSGAKKSDTSHSQAVVTNDASPQDDQNNNNNINPSPQRRPSIVKRNSSLQNAPRIAANTAAKIVTGVDMNGMAKSQQSIRQMEEQEQQRDFVQNSFGQPVYVGRNKNSIVERQSSSGSAGGGGSGSGGGVASPNNDTPPGENLDELLAGVFTAADVAEPVVNDPEVGFCNDENENDGDYDLTDELYSHPQDRGNPFLVSLSGYLPPVLLPYKETQFANHYHFFFVRFV